MTGRQILITGATNGIGLAAAKALAALDGNVAIVGRSESRTKAAAAQIKAGASRDVRVDTFIADLSSQAAVRKLAAEVLARYARLDVLLSNSGAIFPSRQLTAGGVVLSCALARLATGPISAPCVL